MTERDVERLRARVAAELTRTRARTALLTDAVDDDDLVRQHSPLMSPLVWDLAHVGNQEELWLVRDVGGREPVRRDIDELYDAFKHARADRPELPLLGPAEARGLRRHGPRQGARPARHGAAGGPAADRGRVRLRHDRAARAAARRDDARHPPAAARARPVLARRAPPARRRGRYGGEVLVPGGAFTMGTSTDPWALDNERPAHQVDVPAFFIDAAPVTNARVRRRSSTTAATTTRAGGREPAGGTAPRPG